jgi:hypothetical protein
MLCELAYSRKTTMKKILLLALTLLSNAQAEELRSFAGINEAISGGEQLTFVIHLEQCQSAHRLPQITGLVKPNVILVVANNSVKASHRTFTLNNPNFLDVPVFEYNKYTIGTDGKVSIKVTTMKATTYEKLASHEVQCTLGVGFKVFEQEGMRSARG